MKFYRYKHYWNSTYPLVQAAIKELLPAALEDPHGKIRTAVGMAIASIANWDWPEEWPGLMGYLLSLINHRTDVNKGNGYGIRGQCCLCGVSKSSDVFLL